MSLLFAERPLVINTQLAMKIGLNEAIVLQQLHYWLRDTNSGMECDGVRWIYNTTEQWLEQFPFWSESTLKRALPTFIEAYNNRFATSPRTTDNAHLDVHHSEEELGYIFSLQAKRVLSKNLTFQYKSSAFQVRSEGRGYRLRHSVVTVCENFDGEINVLYDGKALGWEKYVDGPEPIPLDDEKSVHERVDNARIDLRSKYYVKPKADHPWLTRRTQSHQQVKPPKLPKKKPDPDKKD